MANISIEKETPGEIIYVSHFEGQPVHFMQDKRTGEITVNADDVVRAIGEADSFEAFLGSDKGLDFIADWKKEHPNEPFFRWCGDKETPIINTRMYDISYISYCYIGNILNTNMLYVV